MNVTPEMAYPVFASATYTFSPVKWPETSGSRDETRIFFADGQTAGGAHVRYASALTMDIITLTYRSLSTSDKDALIFFFKNVRGAQFEYRNAQNIVLQVSFGNNVVDVSPSGLQWDVSPLVLVVTS